ncbi:MAG: hypothetical protein ACREIU_06510, partial [Planctomycetota bacterium]
MGPARAHRDAPPPDRLHRASLPGAPRTPTNPSGIPTPAKAAAAATALHALLLAVLLADSRGDPTVLLCVGEPLPLPADVGEPVRFAGTGGYDGPFYALVALDPFDGRPTSPFLDDPGKRYGRILLPALAGASGASDLRGVAWRFAVLNLLGAAGVAALVAHSRGGDRRALWIGLAAGAQTGIAVSVARGLPGPVGTALLLLGLHLRERNRDLRALACLALAPLDQELFAVVPVVLAAQALLRRAGRGLLWLLALAPFLA